MSRKQRMNTGSTTESEVVGVSDYLPNIIWLMRFLEAQGYELKLNIMYQDNVSAIQMERHEKKSSSRRTRHFDVRFLNVKDKLQLNNITVVYCPTEKMVADFFTKPLQGAQFRLLRRVIMGMDPVSVLELSKGELIGPKERVGSASSQNPFLGQKRPDDGPSYADAVRGNLKDTDVLQPLTASHGFPSKSVRLQML